MRCTTCFHSESIETCRDLNDTDSCALTILEGQVTSSGFAAGLLQQWLMMPKVFVDSSAEQSLKETAHNSAQLDVNCCDAKETIDRF
jgi:hypothetical protein